MYQRLPSWVLGFHGTDEETVLKIIADSKAHVEFSSNEYDWLGHGAYFWENDPIRAMRFARERMKWKRIVDKKPAVIGAVIDLGHCLNLFDQPALDELKSAYDDLKEDMELLGVPMPANKGATEDLLYRYLDRAVIEHLHQLRKLATGTHDAYQTVRSPFMEGEPLYENTLFRRKNHIQIAVRDHGCIKGYFLPRQFLA
jgi:hypothetical protein